MPRTRRMFPAAICISWGHGSLLPPTGTGCLVGIVPGHERWQCRSAAAITTRQHRMILTEMTGDFSFRLAAGDVPAIVRGLLIHLPGPAARPADPQSAVLEFQGSHHVCSAGPARGSHQLGRMPAIHAGAAVRGSDLTNRHNDRPSVR